MSGVLQWQDFRSDNLKSWNLRLVTSAFNYLTSTWSIAIPWQNSLDFKYLLPKPNNEYSLCHFSQHGITVHNNVFDCFCSSWCSVYIKILGKEPNPKVLKKMVLILALQSLAWSLTWSIAVFFVFLCFASPITNSVEVQIWVNTSCIWVVGILGSPARLLCQEVLGVTKLGWGKDWDWIEASETHRKSEAKQGCYCHSGVLGHIMGWTREMVEQGTSLTVHG